MTDHLDEFGKIVIKFLTFTRLERLLLELVTFLIADFSLNFCITELLK